MIKAEAVDKTTIINILSASFESNQSVNFIIRQDGKRLSRIRALMDYSYELCHLFGDVWLSEDKKACALILYPLQKRLTLKSIWLDIKLIINAIGFDGISKTLNREAQIKKLQDKRKMAYLWFIGVDPKYQNTGVGSKLINELISYQNKKDLPIYLETSSVKNLPWYETLGFQIYDQLELGYTLFFLKREQH